MKKRVSGSVSLDEVFAKAEKSPAWKAAYAKADIEVRMAIDIAKARGRTTRPAAPATWPMLPHNPHRAMP